MTWTGDLTGTRTLDVAPAAIVEGSTFADRYAIEGRLGSGAQSTVYSALDMLSSPPRRVALKVARADETNLSREADLLARVHRNVDVAGVVRLVEPSVREFGGVEYLVLEHIDGPTLRNKTLPLIEVCRVGGVIARTLAAMHEMNIVFADVKPENIILRDDCDPVLIDLGAAREIHDSEAPPLLTPAYASPEQRAGRAPTNASDVYALAVVLEELAAGLRPPESFVSTIMRCKAVDPTERPTAREFSQALEVVCISQGTRQFRRSVLGLVGLLIGLVVIGVVVMMRQHAALPPGQVTKPSLTRISAPGMSLYLALGEAHVYWSDGDGRTVFRSPLGGGPAEMVTQLDKPTHQMAVSGQTLFIRSPGDIWSFANAKLKRFAESTGRGGIVADNRNVVWTNEETGDVVAASVREDAPFRVLASGQARPYSATMDATHVYWANEENGTLVRVPREGGDVEVLVRGQSLPSGTALDETHLYWVDRTAGAILRIPKRGGEPQIMTKVSVGSNSTALTGTHLYWTSSEDGRVMRVPIVGGVAEVMVRGQNRPFDIVARGNDVFFTDNYYQGGVMRLVLP